MFDVIETRLAAALDEAEKARKCIRQQSNEMERDQARESYDHVIAEEVMPVIEEAIEYISQEPREAERLAAFLRKRAVALNKKEG